LTAIITPTLVSQFQRPADIGWYASAYFLPLTVFMPLYGKCYALWRVKWLFILALAILIVGSVVSAAAPSSSIFIAGRAIAGAGAAGIITGAMRIIALAAPRKYRTFLEAAGAAVMGVCTVSGPILGGAIADTIGWQWSFWINVPIAFASVSMILIFFPKESTYSTLLKLPFREKLRRLDLIGACLLIAGLVFLSCTLQSVSTSTNLKNSARLLGISAAVLLVTFLVHSKFINSEVSLIPRRILSVRAVWSCCLGLFFLFAGFINFIFFLSIFFQAVQGQTAQESAVSLLPYVLSVGAGAIITGLAVSKVRYYNPFFILGGALFATGAGLIHTFNIDTSVRTRIGYEVLLGFGVGFLMLANVAACHTSLEEEYHSIAQGLTFFCSLLGS
ncbi:MFS general substrate transporter, partial [Acephala macrosclerotiorum]